MNIEMRWAVQPGTFTKPPRLQYRTCSHWPHWGPWVDVPRVEVPTEAPETQPLQSDWQLANDQLIRAKALVLKLHQQFPETRELIEASTGGWLVWGAERAT